MRFLERVDRYQRAHSRAGFAVGVLYKFIDDNGGYLAALIAYYAFVSLFPLLLLAATILGTVLAGSPQLQHSILDTALSDFPVIGPDLHTPSRIGGGAVGVVVGLLGAAYGAMGVAQAVQYAMNIVWNVPHVDRPNPFKARRRSLLLLATTGLGVLASNALSALAADGAGPFGSVLKAAALAAALLLNTAVFVFAFRVATVRELTTRAVLPGAASAAVLWQLLQAFGVTYVNHVVRNAGSTNGVFALVLGLLAFLHLAAMAVVIGAEINAVRVDELYPRALLPSGEPLAAGDRRLYEEKAKAQRGSGDETVDVRFTADDD